MGDEKLRARGGGETLLFRRGDREIVVFRARDGQILVVGACGDGLFFIEGRVCFGLERRGGRGGVECRRERAVHVPDKRHQGGAAAIDADLARELAQLCRRFVGACVWLAAGNRQRALEELVQAGREPRAAPDLRDLDDLVHDGRQAVGIFTVLEEAPDDDHHAGEGRLSEVGRDVEARRPGSCRRRDAQLGPEPAAVELEALQRVPEDRIEEHDLAGRGQDRAIRADGAVAEPRDGVQGRKGRQHLEQEPERRVDAEARGFLGGQAGRRLEEVADAVPADEFRDHREAAGVALDGAHAREALVLEGRRALHALAKRGLERAELRPELEALEDDAVLAIEAKRPPSQTVVMA